MYIYIYIYIYTYVLMFFQNDINNIQNNNIILLIKH